MFASRFFINLNAKLPESGLKKLGGFNKKAEITSQLGERKLKLFYFRILHLNQMVEIPQAADYFLVLQHPLWK